MNKKNCANIKKRIISLMTSIVLGSCSYAVVKKCDNSLLISFAKANTIDNNFNKGDSIKTKKNINMRLGTSTNTFKLGTIDKNIIVDRIISKNGFDLVRYNNQIFFLSGEFTDSNIDDFNNEYFYVEEDNDIIRTTSKVYLRLGPSKNEKDICLLNSNEELVVLGKSFSYNDSSDIWYLAKYKDIIGFINASYTYSLKNTIQNIDPSISNVEIKNIGYIMNNTCLYNNESIIREIEEYQTVKIIGEKDNYYLVEFEDDIGYISKSDIKTIDGTFVVVDLSDQKVFMYCNTDMVFESYCTTGSNKTPTREGAFKVYERTNSRYFSETAQSKYMWANFDHGNGLHDAPWENPNKFGNEKYRKKNGSKGCVRLPDEAAIFLKKYVKKDTKVLVKK